MKKDVKTVLLALDEFCQVKIARNVEHVQSMSGRGDLPTAAGGSTSAFNLIRDAIARLIEDKPLLIDGKPFTEAEDGK